jgi:hypothetical protein
MPIFHDVDQNSDAWSRLRLGVFTASNFDKIVTGTTRSKSRQWQDHAYHVLAERILMRKEDAYVSEPMIRGQIVQDQAADWYEFDREVETQKIGFISSDDFYEDSRGYRWSRYGCSPDRLVGADGLMESKCPTPRVQLKYWFEQKPDRKYWPQLQGQLWISEREWVDILCWHEELPKVVIRVHRDETFIAILRKEIAATNEFLEGVMDRLGQLQERPQEPTPKATLREMLNATLGV